MGAEAIKQLLKAVDLDLLILELQQEIKETTSVQKRNKVVKKIKYYRVL